MVTKNNGPPLWLSFTHKFLRCESSQDVCEITWCNSEQPRGYHSIPQWLETNGWEWLRNLLTTPSFQNIQVREKSEGNGVFLWTQ